MADIKRTLNELLTSFADNNSQDITPNDIRNLVKSVYGNEDIIDISSDTTINSENTVITLSPIDNTLVITIPSANSNDLDGSTYKGKIFSFINLSSFDISLTSSTGFNKTLKANDLISIISNGSNWVIKESSNVNLTTNKLDKVDTTPQSVASTVDFDGGILVASGYFGATSPNIVFDASATSYILDNPGMSLTIQKIHDNSAFSSLTMAKATSVDGGGVASLLSNGASTSFSRVNLLSGSATTPTYQEFIVDNADGGTVGSFTFTGSGLDITSASGGGSAIKMPDNSWIMPQTAQQSMFLTNGTDPSTVNSTLALYDNLTQLTAGDGTTQFATLNMNSNNIQFFHNSNPVFDITQTETTLFSPTQAAAFQIDSTYNWNYLTTRFTVGIDVLAPQIDGAAIKTPNGSWIRPQTENASLYFTNGVNPSDIYSGVHLNQGQLKINGGNGVSNLGYLQIVDGQTSLQVVENGTGVPKDAIVLGDGNIVLLADGNSVTVQNTSLTLGDSAKTEITLNNTEIQLLTQANSILLSQTTGLKIDIPSKGANKVLTSDLNGFATWQTPTGVSTGSLQDAYDNGELITTDATNGAVTIKRGSALDTDKVLSVENGAGTEVLSVTGEGATQIDGTITTPNLTAPSGAGVALGVGDGMLLVDYYNKISKVPAGGIAWIRNSISISNPNAPIIESLDLTVDSSGNSIIVGRGLFDISSPSGALSFNRSNTSNNEFYGGNNNFYSPILAYDTLRLLALQDETPLKTLGRNALNEIVEFDNVDISGKLDSVVAGTNVSIDNTDPINPIINATGVSTGSLQDAYDNSTSPEITTDATNGALTVKRGSALDTDNIFEGKNGAGDITSKITGEGAATLGQNVTIGTDYTGSFPLTIKSTGANFFRSQGDFNIGWSGKMLDGTSRFFFNSSTGSVNNFFLDLYSIDGLTSQDVFKATYDANFEIYRNLEVTERILQGSVTDDNTTGIQAESLRIEGESNFNDDIFVVGTGRFNNPSNSLKLAVGFNEANDSTISLYKNTARIGSVKSRGGAFSLVADAGNILELDGDTINALSRIIQGSVTDDSTTGIQADSIRIEGDVILEGIVDATPTKALGINASDEVVSYAVNGSASPLTTKGDLYTYDTADSRLPVGTNGQALIANSSTATGLEWQALPGQSTGSGTKVLVQGQMNTTQSFTSAAERIDYVDSTLDINGEWDNTTHRFTVASSGAGVYQFTNTLFVDNAGGWIQIFCKKNGVTQRISASDFASSWDVPMGTTNIELAVGDYVEFWADSTSSFNVSATWYALNNFQITKIGESVTIYNAPTDPRIVSNVSTATLTINSSTTDQSVITAQSGALTIASPTGSPADGQKLVIRIKAVGTSVITWNAIFRIIGTTLPVSTTANKTIYVGVVYNSLDTKWDVVAVAEEA